MASTTNVTVMANTGVPTRYPFLGLPYDVFHELCLYLAPKELLALYRTNKALYNLLKSVDGKSLWKRVWHNSRDSAFPPCPPWMTEPQFVALCYDDYCQRCLQPNLLGAGQIWTSGVRYCPECVKTRFTPGNPLEDLPKGPYLKDFINEPHLFVPSTSLHVAMGDREVVMNHFHAPDVARLRRAMIEAEKGAGSATDLNEKRSSVLQQWRSQMTQYCEHAKLCRIWQKQRSKRIRKQRLLAKRYRREDILSRVKALGYEQDVSFLGHRYEALQGPILAVFDKIDALTDDEWVVIAPLVIAFFDERRTLREWYWHRLIIGMRLGELTKALHEYRQAAPDELLPHPVDIAADPILRPLLTLPVSVNVPYPVFQRLLPRWIQTWRKRRDDLLLSMLTNDAPSLWSCTDSKSHSSPSSPSSRSVARSSASHPEGPAAIVQHFYCTSCKNVISSTVAATHMCCYTFVENWQEEAWHAPKTDGNFPTITDDILDSARARQFQGITNWSSSCLRPCAAVIRDILVTLGLNLKFNWSDMGKIEGMYLRCASCCGDKTLLVMGWRRAVMHAFQEHQGIHWCWVSVPPAVSYKAQLVEHARHKLTQEEMARRTSWKCHHCRIPRAMDVYTKSRMDNHLRFSHCISHPQQGRDYYETAEGTEFLHPTILIAATELRSENLDAVFPEGETFRNEKRVGFLSRVHVTNMS